MSRVVDHERREALRLAYELAHSVRFNNGSAEGRIADAGALLDRLDVIKRIESVRRAAARNARANRKVGGK